MSDLVGNPKDRFFLMTQLIFQKDVPSCFSVWSFFSTCCLPFFFFLLTAGGVTVTTGVFTLGLDILPADNGVLGATNSEKPIEPRCEKTAFCRNAKSKAQNSCAVITQLISDFVFAS